MIMVFCDFYSLFLVDAEGDTIKELMRYYFTGADAPMTLNLLNVGPACGGKCVQNLIETWTEEMPDARPIYWSVSNKILMTEKKIFFIL